MSKVRRATHAGTWYTDVSKYISMLRLATVAVCEFLQGSSALLCALATPNKDPYFTWGILRIQHYLSLSFRYETDTLKL